MADLKISQLPSATTTDGTEVLPVVQSSTTKQMAINVVKNWVLGLTNLFTRAQTIQPSTAETALTIRRATLAQTQDIMMVQAQDNTVLAKFDKDGNPVMPSYQMSSSGIITDATTTRTLAAGDNGKVIYFTSGSAITVNTAAGLGAGFSCVLLQGGAGQITVVQGSSTTLVSYSSLVKSAGQYAAISVFAPVADTFVLSGQTA